MLQEYPHRRLNLLTREWVLVSPHRAQRPWQGQVERTPAPPQASYGPGCYLCPGNQRAGGARNPHYDSTFVFENDFPALRLDAPPVDILHESLLTACAERGVCRVVCFSPDHGLTLSRMALGDIGKVVDAWAAQFAELGSQQGINYVQIFENRGEMMGCSNPHPHGQIWAGASVPNELEKELRAQSAWTAERTSCLLCDYLALERKLGVREVCANDAFAAVVPFWAVWPFETLILSTRHWSGMDEMTAAERLGLADILKRLTTRYDNLFEAPFPYTMGFHQRPTDGQPHPYFHFHAHFYPPLLRSATIRKFMVGYEMLATPQRDLTPESAADRLRALSETHYLEG